MSEDKRFSANAPTTRHRGESQDVDTADEEQNPSSRQRASTPVGKVVLLCACGFALFHLWTALTGGLPSYQQRAVHVGLALVIVLWLHPWKAETSNKVVRRASARMFDIGLITAAVASCGWIVVEFDRIAVSAGLVTAPDIVFGSILLTLVLEAARRTVGLILPLLAILAILYARLGEFIPGVAGHSGSSFSRIIEQLYVSNVGFWGSLTGISATTIAAFLIFGALLLVTGGGKVFIDLASYLVGRFKGGPAYVALVGSALFGTVSGSSVANVATTGTFTIPLMKRSGYRASFAGGVEASASTGGQIMPPVMGSTAFLMAVIIGVPYSAIMIAGILPALVFFIGGACVIFAEARALGLQPMSAHDRPRRQEVVTLGRLAPLAVPLIVLVYLILRGYTPEFAAVVAIGLILVFYVINRVRIGGLSAANARISAQGLYEAFIQGGRSVAQIGVLIACVSIVVSMLSLTGGAVSVSNLLASGIESKFGVLFLTMCISIVLGMGLPSPAAYVITAGVMGGVATAAGIEPIAAHFFFFYFAIMSAITPPVCVAAFVAASIAKTSWLPTAGAAVRMGIAGFLVPWVFVYNPSLLLGQGAGGSGEPGALQVFVSAVVAIAAIGVGLRGHVNRKMTLAERVMSVGGGVLLMVPETASDFIGLALIGLAVLLYMGRARREVRRLPTCTHG